MITFSILILLVLIMHDQYMWLKEPTESLDLTFYQCPKAVRDSRRNIPTSIQNIYDETIKESFSGKNNNSTTIIENYNKSYLFYNFRRNNKIRKKQVSTFFDNIKSGDLIYESACGMGFNLAVTLQLLQETKNVVNLTVYGNDYFEKNVKFANNFFDTNPPAGARKGSICVGDSTSLDF